MHSRYFTFFLIIFLSLCFANPEMLIEKKFIEGANDTVISHFTVTKDNNGIQVKNGICYGLYKSNNQKYIEGQKINNVNEGAWTWWYKNGQVMQKATYKNGKFDGKMTAWYENGAKKFEANNINGIQNGNFIVWDENGNVIQNETYVNGKITSSLKPTSQDYSNIKGVEGAFLIAAQNYIAKVNEFENKCYSLKHKTPSSKIIPTVQGVSLFYQEQLVPSYQKLMSAEKAFMDAKGAQKYTDFHTQYGFLEKVYIQDKYSPYLPELCSP